MRTLGVEEELLVVDPTGYPVPLGPEALEAAARHGEGEDVDRHDRVERGEAETPAGAHLMPELKAQQVELGTAVCDSLAAVEAQLRHWRARADAAARTAGARIAALATSPLDCTPTTTPGERYHRMVEAFGLIARDQLTCGCHVHVSVDDDEEGVDVLNRIRPWLPVLTALTANSPFWLGADSGYASFRSQAWNRWPSAGPTEPFADAAEYHQVISALIDSRTILDTGMIYFDARLSTEWPTVEIRVADVALRVEDAVTHAGLVRGLVETAARDRRSGRPVPRLRGEILRVAAWRAGRSGLTGDLLHPLTGRPAPAGDVVAALLDHVRAALADAGDERRIDDGVADILRRGTGADLQRRIHRETADLSAVVRAAVQLSTG